jgi:hypothetical protein
MNGFPKCIFLPLFALAASGIAAAQPALSQQAAPQKGPTTIPVTSTVYDVDTANPSNLLLTRSDHYNGSQQATYTNTGGVDSHIAISGGSWQLFLGAQSLRTLWLTLASQGAPVPDGLYSANVEVYSRCWDANNNETGFLTIAPGTSNNLCSFGVDFTSGRTKYKLVMSPLTQPGSGWATVSCNGPLGGGSCNSWTIVPNMVAANATVARLYQFANNGSLTYIGSYHNTFRVDVTNP